MINYNYNEILNWNLGTDNIIKVYRNGAVCYYKVVGGGDTPTSQTPCYAVVVDISQYQETEFEDVFNKLDNSWYKLNNLLQYEKYGLYGSGRTITHYAGKLTIDDGSEYIYSGGSWVNLGEVSGSTSYNQLTFDFDRSIGFQQCIIDTSHASSCSGGYYFCTFQPTPNYSGEHASITDYSIVICEEDYWFNGSRNNLSSLPQAEGYSSEWKLLDWGETMYYAGAEHNSPVEQILVYSDATEYPMYYTAMQNPPTEVSFSSMTEALQYQCPYVGLFATIDGVLYVFNDEYQWEELAFTISGVTTSSSPFDLNINLSSNTVVVYKENQDHTYNWGLNYTSPITNTSGMCLENSSLKSFDWGTSDTSQLTAIGDSTFDHCSSLTSATIPSGVTAINQFAFQACTNLESVTIPNTVTSIGEGAFNGCYNLYDVNIPSGVTSIGLQAFASCSSISVITIPSGVTTIGDYAFQDCWRLIYVNLEEGLTSIGGGMFWRCQNLQEIDIPSSVTTIGGYAFQNCYSLGSVTLHSTTPPTLDGESVFTNTNNCPIYVPCSAVDTYRNANLWSSYASRIVGYESCTTYDWETVSGEYVCFIGDKYEKTKKIRSFDGGQTWEDVYPEEYGRGQLIESGSTDCQIVGCPYTLCGIDTNGDSIILSGQSWIDEGNFSTDIVEGVIGDECTEIGIYAFWGCFDLETIEIGENVGWIDEFAFDGCDSLESIIVKATFPPTLGFGAFYGTNDCPIYVPSASEQEYKEQWSDYEHRIIGI